MSHFCLAHLNHCDQRAVLIKGGKGFASKDGDMGRSLGSCSTASRVPHARRRHSIYSAIEGALASGFATAELHPLSQVTSFDT
jgi:hypothetical protein